MIILDPSGKDVSLGRKLGGGGEAEVFEVADQAEVVAKIYRKPTRFHETKLQAMIANPPRDPTLHLGHATICWPISLLYNQAGSCTGFLMHRVDTSTHVQALKIYNPKDRQSVSLSITWKYVIRTAENIASAVEAIHLQNHVIGDFNESNILVANNALITLVDCDSMQVYDPQNGVVYRCLVGKPDFTPPELQGCEFAKVDRCFAHDNFGLAVIVFLLLMEGTHPFNGVWRRADNPPVLEDRIRHGYSPYADQRDISCPPAAPSFGILPQRIADLFVRCFKDGHRDPSLRPSPAEWKSALAELDENLAQCPNSVRHIYSSHLLACPWCERKTVLGGIDPYPVLPEKITRKAASAAGSLSSDPGDIPYSRFIARRALWRHPLVKRISAVMVLATIAAFLWMAIRRSVRDFWASLDIAPIFHPSPVLQLSPLFICTGIDSKGSPVGVSDTFASAEVSKTGIMAVLNYFDAVPQKNTFQIRWKIENRTYESGVNRFEQAADFIALNLGKNLPAGTHTIEFLVDGSIVRTASIKILPSSENRSNRSGRYQKPRPTVQDLANAGVPVYNIGPFSPARVQAPVAPEPAKKAEERVEIHVPSKSAAEYKARHWHTIGSCLGDLKLTAQDIEFTSEQHTFKFDIKDISVNEDSVRDPRGRDWRFIIQGQDVNDLLGKWKRGEMFPVTKQTEVSVNKAVQESQPLTTRVYVAKHKHRFGSCQGELKLTSDTLEFSSDQHYVKYHITQIIVEGDGLEDHNRRSWHFEIPGENASSILRLWKNNQLFPK